MNHKLMKSCPEGLRVATITQDPDTNKQGKADIYKSLHLQLSILRFTRIIEDDYMRSFLLVSVLAKNHCLERTAALSAGHQPRPLRDVWYENKQAGGKGASKEKL